MRVLILVLGLLAALLVTGCASDLQDETEGWSAQRLYGEAKDAMGSKDWPRAIRYLEKLEARYPYGRYAQQAQLEIANHSNVEYAWYLKGLINFNDQYGMMSQITTPDMSDRDPKSTRESFAAFKELVTRFPNSRYAPDAMLRMRYLVNALASHEVHVARYYMKRGAYLAAANRAQYAIAHYQQAPALEEAVFVLVLAYDRLGMNDLRDAADRVMRTNFPDSRYLKPGGLRKDVPWWRLWDPDW